MSPVICIQRIVSIAFCFVLLCLFLFRENHKVPVMEDKFLNTSPRNLDLNYPKPSSHPVSLISRADCGRKQDKLQLQGGQGHPQQASSTAAAAEKPSEGMVVKEA